MGNYNDKKTNSLDKSFDNPILTLLFENNFYYQIFKFNVINDVSSDFYYSFTLL